MFEFFFLGYHLKYFLSGILFKQTHQHALPLPCISWTILRFLVLFCKRTTLNDKRIL